MKKFYLILSLATLLIFSAAPLAEARGRTGSIRIGGYATHGKGSHYVGGYVRTGRSLRHY